MDYVCTADTSVLEILPAEHIFSKKTHLDMLFGLSLSQFSSYTLGIRFLKIKGGSGTKYSRTR